MHERKPAECDVCLNNGLQQTSLIAIRLTCEVYSQRWQVMAVWLVEAVGLAGYEERNAMEYNQFVTLVLL